MRTLQKAHHLMTQDISKPPQYPNGHILVAGGVALLLSIALLAFPTREVEAQHTHLIQEASSLLSVFDTDSPDQQTSASPFADTLATMPGDTEAASDTTPELTYTTVIVAKGDTLSTIFTKIGLSANTLHELLNSDKEANRFTRLKAGQTLEFTLTADGQLAQLASPLNSLETIRITRSEEGFEFHKDVLKPETQTVYAHGVIDNSLFLTGEKAGLSHKLIMDLANVFGYDIDFALDIRQGDEFELIYEEKTVGDKRVATGHILSARFTNQGKTYTAIRYTNQQGFAGYYTAEGNNTRKAFIRTPVDLARISSRFSNGRKHPILNNIRAHKGVDYAAPRGTPIKATGDGRIVLAKFNGGYGNTVIIQHGQRYRTLYAHMNGFAKGIRNGVQVQQGQIIGYIGTTGLSTGPHLHYEFQVNGKHVDPLSEKLPVADPIASNEKKQFMALSQSLLARMDQDRATMLAAAGSTE